MNVTDRAKRILLSPAKEWEIIKKETISIGGMFTGYAAYLAAIPAVAGLIGRSLIGYSFMGFQSRFPFGSGLAWAVLYYLFSLGGVYLLGVIVDMLAPAFGARKDINASMKVAVFSSTAIWVAGVFAIIPALAPLSIVGLYSLYLLYVGMKLLKEPVQDKMVGYFVITLIVSIFIYFIIGLIVSAIALGGYALSGGFRGY